MQTQKNILSLGLASLGAITTAGPSLAAPRAVNNVTEVSITTEQAATRIIITGSQAFTPEVKSLGKTGITSITLPGIWQAGRAGTQSVQKNGVAFVRYGQYSMKPSQQVRIVANYSSKTRKALKYELVPSEDKTRWEVVLYAPGAEVAELGAGEVRPVELAPLAIAAAAPKASTHLHLASLQADKDPVPGISVRSQRTTVSVDTRALAAAATRVASSTGFAPFSAAKELSAPRLSLASVLALTPRSQPLTSTPAASAEPKLKPYPTRSAEPKVVATRRAPLPKVEKIEKAERPVTIVEALAAPVARATEPQQKKPITVTATPPKPESTALAAPAAPLVPLATPESKPAAVQTDPLERLVSLDFVNSELSDVLKLLSVQAKVNVVSGQSIIGKKVTLSLQKIMLRDALDWITRTSGISYTMEGANTIIVGTSQEVTLLRRTNNQTLDVVPANISFFYADAESLKTALTASFPNVAIHIIKASEESKKPEEQNSQTTQGVRAPTGEIVGATTTTQSNSSMTAIKPRGGSVFVVGTRAVVDEIRRTIEDTERGLIEIAQKDADRKSEQMRSFVNDVYEVRYVDPTQVSRLVLESVPNIIIRPGPSQRFIATPGGLGGALGAIGGGGAGGAGGQTPVAGGAQAGGAQAGGAQGGVAGGAQGGQVGMGGQGTVESRVLLLTGKAQDVARAKEMLNQLDVKMPQFNYEARLVEVSKDDLKKLGINYDFGRAVQIGENDRGGNGSVINKVEGGRVPNGGAIFRTPYSVASQIDALATLGKANILARPNLSALDGNPAVTFIGDQIPYVISQSISPTGGLNVITGVANAGIQLQVTGRSNGDGTMTIYVHPEISTITQFIGGLPQISRRMVDTTIRIKDGDTIAIGGLVQKQDIDTMKKVPGLGDLPVLGQLFRSSERRVKESEVLIFITCRLTKD